MRQQFTYRVLGRSPRRKGCGENAEGGCPQGEGFSLIIIKTHVYIPAVMEHVELAGIHSGNSACVIPTVSIPADNLARIKEYTKKIASALKVCGLMNMQYAIENERFM